MKKGKKWTVLLLLFTFLCMLMVFASCAEEAAISDTSPAAGSSVKNDVQERLWQIAQGSSISTNASSIMSKFEEIHSLASEKAMAAGQASSSSSQLEEK